MNEYFPKNAEIDFSNPWVFEEENDNPDTLVAMRDGSYAGVYGDEASAAEFESLYDKDPLDIHSDRE